MKADLEATPWVTVEGNVPATFGNPLWSLRGDFEMVYRMITGTMDAEVERCCRAEPEAPAAPATDAERALDELRAQPRVVEPAEDDDSAIIAQARLDRVLTDMAATAERLARTEEELARVRADATAREGERDGKAADVESLLAQLTDRDLRIAALERRREEELNAVQRSLTLESQANRTLRTSLDAVRSGLSAILVDGRGAMVAHDLMALLRRIEDA